MKNKLFLLFILGLFSSALYAQTCPPLDHIVASKTTSGMSYWDVTVPFSNYFQDESVSFTVALGSHPTNFLHVDWARESSEFGFIYCYYQDANAEIFRIKANFGGHPTTGPWKNNSCDSSSECQFVLGE